MVAELAAHEQPPEADTTQDNEFLGKLPTIPWPVRREFISRLRTSASDTDLEGCVGIATAKNWQAAFEAMDQTVFGAEFSQDDFKSVLERNLESKGKPPGWVALERSNIEELAHKVQELMADYNTAVFEEQSADSCVRRSAMAERKATVSSENTVHLS